MVHVVIVVLAVVVAVAAAPVMVMIVFIIVPGSDKGVLHFCNIYLTLTCTRFKINVFKSNQIL